jgi:hypothetical protein
MADLAATDVYSGIRILQAQGGEAANMASLIVQLLKIAGSLALSFVPVISTIMAIWDLPNTIRMIGDILIELKRVFTEGPPIKIVFCLFLVGLTVAEIRGGAPVKVNRSRIQFMTQEAFLTMKAEHMGEAAGFVWRVNSEGKLITLPVNRFPNYLEAKDLKFGIGSELQANHMIPQYIEKYLGPVDLDDFWNKDMGCYIMTEDEHNTFHGLLSMKEFKKIGPPPRLSADDIKDILRSTYSEMGLSHCFDEIEPFFGTVF